MYFCKLKYYVLAKDRIQVPMKEEERTVGQRRTVEGALAAVKGSYTSNMMAIVSSFLKRRARLQRN